MSEQRFIRNLQGDIYDSENDKWLEEDWKGKPLDYDDEVIRLLNEQQELLDKRERQLQKAMIFIVSDVCSLSEKKLAECIKEIENV